MAQKLGHLLHLLVPLISIAMTQSCSRGDSQLRIDFQTDLVAGYESTISGEDLLYHSPIPHVDHSLLVRSLERERHIEWETAPVPTDFEGDSATFVFLAAIDINEDVRQFYLFVNEKLGLKFQNPNSVNSDRLAWVGEHGVRADFRVTEIDKYDDAMGYLFLHVPRQFWEESRTLRLRVAGESADKSTWFMIFKEPITAGVTISNSPALLRGENGHRQALRADFLYLEDSGHLVMSAPESHVDTVLGLGHRQFLLPVPAVDQPEQASLSFEVDGHKYTAQFTIDPVEQMDIFLIHHTHLDIGYTHHQSDVERLQWQYL